MDSDEYGLSDLIDGDLDNVFYLFEGEGTH